MKQELTFKEQIMFTPLILKSVKVSTPTSKFEGEVLFESANMLYIQNFEDENTKKILKSSIETLYIYSQKKQQFVEVDVQLIKGTLISRLKKMK